MMSRNTPWQSYRKIAVQTASPGHLVLMLYDGAIGFMEKSLAGFERKDPAEFNQAVSNNLIRAQAIFREMNARLDMERGGEIAQNFRRLYNYFTNRLLQANIRKNKEPIEEVLGHVRIIRDSWAEMLARGLHTADAAQGEEQLQTA